MAIFVWWDDQSSKLPESLAAENYSDGDARHRWEHEDNLINHRVTWLGLTQGLLFAAYGATFQLSKETWHNEKQFKLFIEVLPGAGIWISLVVFAGVLAAGTAMLVIYARSPWRQPGITWLTTLFGWACGAAMPWVFVFVWLKLLDTNFLSFVWKTLSSVGKLLFG